MNEEYVNKEITRKLIDKGCPVRLVIKADALIPILYELPKEHPDWQYCKAWYIPTISQVLKWLREEHYIDIVISPIFVDYCKSEYYCVIYSPDRGQSVRLTYFHTYEQAAIAGISYALDNLI